MSDGVAKMICLTILNLRRAAKVNLLQSEFKIVMLRREEVGAVVLQNSFTEIDVSRGGLHANALK